MKGLLCVYYGALCSIVFAQTGVQLYEAGRKAHVQEDWHAAIEFYQEALKKKCFLQPCISWSCRVFLRTW